jgi:hypothetical protein
MRSVNGTSKLEICVSLCVALSTASVYGSAIAQPVAPASSSALEPSEEAMRAFLVQGKWNAMADDNNAFTGEVLQADFIKSLVRSYEANPEDPTAIANLSLIPLALAVAEWGVSPTTALPADPVKDKWGPVTSTGDGKHLMSYSKGGIGVMHQDSGGLARLMAYLEANHPDVVPAVNKKDFFKLKGVNFDRLYAAGGHCTAPTSEVRTDLSGAEFQHTVHGYAGEGYCLTYNKPAFKLTPRDWQVFRHGMREALRREDVQFRIIRDFANNEWLSAYRLAVVQGGHDVREAFVLARIWNSSPVLAKCAYERARDVTGTSDRIKKELEAYAAGCANSKPRMKERWPYMQRSVLVYEAFSTK